jgi:hypothetical protein
MSYGLCAPRPQSYRRMVLPDGGSFDIPVELSGPVLRGHQVGRKLEDRVAVLQGLVWGTVRNGGLGRPGTGEVVKGSLRDPAMRQIGLLITRGCPARNDMCELQAIFDFIQRNIRYTGDITFKDTFQSGWRTMQFGGGDCDDHAELGAVLCMENGYQCKWRITSNTGATWDHIYLMAGIPKHRPASWVALDTTLGKGKFARQPPSAKFRDFPVREG